eukprot:2257477-Amphidinium_carterae.1
MHTQLTSFLVKLSEHTVIKDNRYKYLHWPGTDQYIQVLKHTDILKELGVTDRLLSLHTVAGTCRASTPQHIWALAPTHAGISDLARTIRDRAMSQGSQGECTSVNPTDEESQIYQDSRSKLATEKIGMMLPPPPAGGAAQSEDNRTRKRDHSQAAVSKDSDMSAG